MDFYDYSDNNRQINVTPILDKEFYEHVLRKVTLYDHLFPFFFDRVRTILDNYKTNRGITEDTIDSLCCVFKFSDPEYIHGYGVDFAQIIEAKHLELMCLLNADAVREFSVEDIYILEYIIFRAFTFCTQLDIKKDENNFLKSDDEIQQLGLSFSHYTGIDCLKQISDLFYIKKLRISTTSMDNVDSDEHNRIDQSHNLSWHQAYIENERITISILVNSGDICKKKEMIENHITMIKEHNATLYSSGDSAENRGLLPPIMHRHLRKGEPTPISYNLALILFHRYRLTASNDNLDDLVAVICYCITQNFRPRTRYSVGSINTPRDIIKREIYKKKVAQYEASSKTISSVFRVADFIKEYFRKFNDHIGFNRYDEAIESELIDWDDQAEFAYFKKKRNASLDLRLERKKQLSLKNASVGQNTTIYDQAIADIDKEIAEIEFRMDVDIAPGFIVKTLDFIYLLIQTIPFIIDSSDNDEEIDRLETICDDLEDIERDFRRSVYSKNGILKNYRRNSPLNIERIKDNEREYQHRIELQTEQNRIELLKENILYSVNALYSSDLNGIMQNRLSVMRNFALTDADYEFLDDISLRISSFIQEKVKDQKSFIVLKQELLADLQNHHKVIPENVLETLVTAEYLYSMYIKGKEPMADFDYSCISALYYQAFEALYNTLIVSPYVSEVSSTINYSVLVNRCKLKPYKRINTKEEGYGFFPEKYIGQFVDYKGLKQGCMLWDFENILNLATIASPEVEYFINYLDRILINGWRNVLPSFISALRVARPHRNDASHGGTIVSFDTASKDKERILITSEFERANMFKNLIKQLLSLIQ